MLRTLRSQLILSHILPTLIVLPLMGVVLVFLVETQVLLANLSREVTGEAVLTAELASQSPDVFLDKNVAKIFIDRLVPFVPARIMILDPKGILLASTDPNDSSLEGKTLSILGLANAQAKNIDSRITYSQVLSSEVVDVLVPVLDANNNVVGIIRLTHELSSVLYQFQRVRIMITAVVAGGLLVAALLGWFLAVGLEQPLKRVTLAVTSLARGEPQNIPAVRSPMEIHDLTEAMNTLVNRLDTLEQSRRRLLANLVHEIGRPLGALQSGLQALEGGADSDPQLRQELLAGMEGEVQILERLLDELSQIYDQILGSLELERQPAETSDWLQSTLAPWRESAQSKRLSWEANIPSDLPSVEIDPGRMSQAVGNLMSNAIKYTPSGGKIIIEAGAGSMNLTNEMNGPRQACVWIRVRDTGPGIPEEEQEKIFTPFYRGSKQRRYPYGMGLGLTIAADMVHAHGGKLTLDSKPGKGSSFTIWLPLTPIINP